MSEMPSGAVSSGQEEPSGSTATRGPGRSTLLAVGETFTSSRSLRPAELWCDAARARGGQAWPRQSPTRHGPCGAM